MTEQNHKKKGSFLKGTAQTQKGGMSYDEIKSMSVEYLLPCKVIYELNSEFNCLIDIAMKNEKLQKEEEAKKKQA